MMTKTLKLSELADDVEVGREYHHTTYTVAELKHEILKHDEPHHEDKDWYTVKHQKWQPCAKTMIENYIENESQDMYDDWDERANDCLTDDVVQRIQAILDEAFATGHATDYWTFEQRVMIDIKPMSKLDILNSIGIEDHSAACGELEYILIKNTPENRERLFKIGATEHEVNDSTDETSETINISMIGFKYTEATHFSQKDQRFFNQATEPTQDNA